MFYRNAVLKNFATFTGKHLCWSLVLNKFAGLQGKMLFLILLKCAAIRKIFKACVRHFLTNFCFSPNDSPSKTMKDVLFHLKSCFCSWDIQFSVFPSSLLFIPVIHCFRAWSKINLKNLTHFAWYLGREKSYDNENLSIDRVLNMDHFLWKIMQKMCTKS